VGSYELMEILHGFSLCTIEEGRRAEGEGAMENEE
jgi:hypothetical protein